MALQNFHAKTPVGKNAFRQVYRRPVIRLSVYQSLNFTAEFLPMQAEFRCRCPRPESPESGIYCYIFFSARSLPTKNSATVPGPECEPITGPMVPMISVLMPYLALTCAATYFASSMQSPWETNTYGLSQPSILVPIFVTSASSDCPASAHLANRNQMSFVIYMHNRLDAKHGSEKRCSFGDASAAIEMV